MTSQFNKIGFVNNPRAGKGKSGLAFEKFVRPLIEKYFAQKEHKILITEKQGGGFDCAQQLARDGFDLIVSCGGDGTNHEVLNGIIDVHQDGKLPAMSIIPMGTGDDFARSLGLSFIHIKDDAARFETIVKTLAQTGKVIQADIGSVDATPLPGKQKRREWFLNESSFGFSADVIQSVNEQSSFWISKDFTMQSKSLTLQFSYKNKQIELEFLDASDAVVHKQIAITQLAAVSNGQYFGAGMQINPGAAVDDGEFNVCMFGDVNVWNIMWIIPKVYTGEHVIHEKISFKKCAKLRANPTSEEKVFIEADGEVVGSLPAEFICHHNRIPFVVPATE